ncbi:hypothetical protein WAX78_14040 [Bacillus sp. FJAT-53711]|uniref:Uncharacterized protein n=1 Tax=Bacillus yunxiaonensis TaxID=3127665 RepID=A0ABU8FXA7_9BACI
MEINRVTTGKTTFEPLQQPSSLDKGEVTTQQKQNTISFAIDRHIVTKGEQVGIIVSNVQDGQVAVRIILNELKSVLQLFQQLQSLLEQPKGQNEQMYQGILQNVQELVKHVHVRQIPLLDGTYDFIELPVSFQQYGKQVTIPLLDVLAFTHMLEQDSSKVEMVVQTITAYMMKLSNESTGIDATTIVSKELDVGMWRALAEMSMTQLSQQMKQWTMQHKWSITIFFLLIWMICIFVI